MLFYPRKSVNYIAYKMTIYNLINFSYQCSNFKENLILLVQEFLTVDINRACICDILELLNLINFSMMDLYKK